MVTPGAGRLPPAPFPPSDATDYFTTMGKSTKELKGGRHRVKKARQKCFVTEPVLFTIK